MPESPHGPHWTRHFVYRTEQTRTTWKFRLGLVALLAGAVWFTGGWWMLRVARSLVCEANATPSDAILLENFDSDYLVFERAAKLRQAGLAERVLVPVPMAAEPGAVNLVALHTAELMATLSGLGGMDIVPIRQVEPISLNAARDIQRFIAPLHVRSVIVVSPLFRSRRSALVYAATLGGAGITVRCEPAEGSQGVNSWARSWHGIQDVVEQFIKLQYYRFYVLPFPP